MNLETKLSRLFIYGIAIFPFFLLVGPLVSELFLISVIIYFFYFIIKDNQFRFLNNRYLIFFGIFYLSVLFSTILNFIDFNHTKGGLFYFRIPLYAFAIWFILEKFNNFDKKIVFFYSVFLFILICDSLIQYYFGKNLVGFELKSGRVSSFFGEELILGSFILRTLPIFLIYLIMSEILTEKSNLIIVILISFSCSIIYLSGERSSFGLIILFFFTLFFISKNLRKFIIFIMLSFIFISIILTNLQNSDKNNPAVRMFSNTYNQVVKIDKRQDFNNENKLINKVYMFSYDHHYHYLLAYKIFKDHMIFGTGVKGFRYLCRKKIYTLNDDEGCSTHPHNTYVQILVSNGLVGFSLLILGLFYVIKEIFMCRKKINSSKKFDKYEISKAIAIAAIFVNIWPLVPNGNFFNNWLSMFYFYPIGFYLYFKDKNEKKIS